jgi:hypothetical protein
LLHLLWIVPLVLLIVFLSSPRFRGDIAETRTRRLLSHGLERNLYTVFNGVVLPIGGGTIVVEHVAVSRFGIFVFHSEFVRGWISGGELQPRWRQKRLARTVLFDNPLHRNRLQVEALQRLLDYPASVFHPFVVLVGQAGFKGKPPENVLSPSRLLAQVRKKTRHLLTPEQADHAVRCIDEARLKSPRRRPLLWLRLLLLAAVLAGAWFAFRGDIQRIVGQYRQEAAQAADPAAFHPDGRPKTEREQWEDSLACAYSVDTGRCACYEPSGARADLDEARCRELAERGSVLKQ